MRKPLWIVASLALSLALSAAAGASDDQSDRATAVAQCKQERSAMGLDNFRSLYGRAKNGRNAFGKCVSAHAKRLRQGAERAAKNAAKACKEEQAADPDAFKQKYGSGKNGSNAMGKCVSEKVKQAREDAKAKAEKRLNAAKACKEEQAADPDAFKQKYGTNESGRNAFGKCVSQNVGQPEEEAPPQPS